MTTSTIQQTGFVRRHPIISFSLLALALGTGMISLVALGVLPGFLALASAISASIAGIIMTATLDGRAGLRLMLDRLRNWRVPVGYWLFAGLFIVPVLILGSQFNPLFNGDPVSIGDLALGIEILPMFVGFVVVAGLGQELGWTGFLLPRLQARHSALASCVFRAILVGLWHLPLLLYSRQPLPGLSDFPYDGWIAQKGFLVSFLTLTLLFSLPWSILMGWMFNNTRGSLLLVAVLHGSEIWVAYGMLSAGIDPRNLDNYWGYGAVLALAAVAIVMLAGWRDLSRRHQRITYRPG